MEGCMARLSVSESIQHSVIVRYLEGLMDQESVCDRLNIHRSTLWRKIKRYQEYGPPGLAHRSRGKPGHRRLDSELHQAVCRLYREEYLPFGYTTAHFYQEAIEHQPSYPVSYPTVLRWFKQARLVTATRKSAKHRSRRPRKDQFGELLQQDTSIHDWLCQGQRLALISAIDDCTSTLCGLRLFPSDTTCGNMTVLHDVIARYGLPAALYVDRSPIFKVTRTGGIGKIVQPTFEAPYITQFQRALTQLGIELIHAYSPQSKGRVERSYGSLQNRLLPEFKKNGITCLTKANAYLNDIYRSKHNQRFAADPAWVPSAFVPLLDVDLSTVLAEKYQLTVSNDHIVSSKLAGVALRIKPDPKAGRISFAKAKVDVFKHLDGTVTVRYQGKPLPVEPLDPLYERQRKQLIHSLLSPPRPPHQR